MLGIKHLCKSCQTKFYNFSDKVNCPACGMSVSDIDLDDKGVYISKVNKMTDTDIEIDLDMEDIDYLGREDMSPENKELFGIREELEII